MEANGFGCLQKLLSLINNASLLSNILQTLDILNSLVFSRRVSAGFSLLESLANNVLSSHDVESLLLLLLCTLLDRDTFEAYNQRLDKPVVTRELLQQVLTLISEQAAASGDGEMGE